MIIQRGCSVWVKKPAFPFQFLVYEVYRSEFCMSVYHHIRQLVVKEFFPTRFSWKMTQIGFLLFSPCYQNTSRIKSPLKYKSVCGRVVKPSSLSTALSSYNRSITGSSPDGVDSPIILFGNFQLKCCLPVFIADLLYFIVSYYTSSSSH